MNENPNNQDRQNRNWLWLIGIPLIIIIGLWVLTNSGATKQDKTYSEIVGYFEQNQVEEFTLSLDN